MCQSNGPEKFQRHKCDCPASSPVYKLSIFYYISHHKCCQCPETMSQK